MFSGTEARHAPTYTPESLHGRTFQTQSGRQMPEFHGDPGAMNVMGPAMRFGIAFVTTVTRFPISVGSSVLQQSHSGSHSISPV